MKRLLDFIKNLRYLNRLIAKAEIHDLRLDALEHADRAQAANAAALRSQHDQRLDAMRSEHDLRLDALEDAHRQLAASLDERAKKAVAEQIFYQATAMHQRIDQFLFDDQHRDKDTAKPELAVSSSLMMDEYYVAFENTFRGARPDILNRYIFYLDFITLSGVQKALDIGCGRGEWVELLQQKGVECHGVDMNTCMVSICEKHHVNHVKCQNAVDYLQASDDSSFDLVTLFHIIEHLPLETLLLLLAQVMRVLKPSGRIVMETPNPDNLLVSSLNFYLDPTHKNPVPKEVSQFLLSHAGFSGIQTVVLNPFPETMRFRENSAMSTVLNERMFGPQDYLVIGHK